MSPREAKQEALIDELVEALEDIGKVINSALLQNNCQGTVQDDIIKIVNEAVRKAK